MIEPAPRAVRLRISADAMEAVLEINALSASENAALVMHLINEHEIRFGLDAPAVQRAVDTYRSTGQKQTAIVARGIHPEPSADGRIEILVPPVPPVVIDPEGRADYRNLQRYRVVDANSLLARRIPPVKGKAGIDVFGNEIDPGEAKDVRLTAGPNVEFIPASNEYRARVHGIFIHTQDRIEVNPLLEISGNVGLESGNIQYDGSVKVSGNVERGAALSAMGDVTIGGAVESGDVTVSGSLTVHGGINHRREGSIKVSGNLSAVYVDNSNVTVGGSILVERSITASHVICLGEIIVRGPGGVAGGEIVCYGSITADTIGSKVGVPTRIVLGMHPENAALYEKCTRDLEHATHAYERAAETIQKIKSYLHDHHGPLPVDKQAAFRIKVREYKEAESLVHTLSAKAAELRAARFNAAAIRITARDHIYPGVEISYRGHTETISQAFPSQVLVFSPGAPVVREPWVRGR